MKTGYVLLLLASIFLSAANSTHDIRWKHHVVAQPERRLLADETAANAIKDDNLHNAHRRLLANKTAARDDLIAYGENASQGQFPYMASLQALYSGGYGHFCGGSLIAPNLVLTAAHCVVDSNKVYPPDRITVGSTKWWGSNDNNVFTVTDVFVHPSYDSSQWDYGAAQNDVAIVKLRGDASVSPVPLATTAPSSGQTVTAIGWGAIEVIAGQVTYPDDLKYTTMTVGQNGKDGCPYLSNGMICTQGKVISYNQYSSTCQGDSGGPHVVNGKLMGVTSFGPNVVEKCGSSPYQGLTDVAYFYNSFIKPIMQQHGTGGVVDPPTPSPSPDPIPDPSPDPGTDNGDYKDCSDYTVLYYSKSRWMRGTLLKTLRVRSLAACANACIDDANCMTFNYYRAYRRCTMFSETESELNYRNDRKFMSGYLECADY